MAVQNVMAFFDCFSNVNKNMLNFVYQAYLMNGSYGELVSIFYLKRLRNYVKKNYAAGHCKMWFYLFELTLAKKRFTPCEMVTVLENSVFFVYHFVSGHLGVLTDAQ